MQFKETFLILFLTLASEQWCCFPTGSITFPDSQKVHTQTQLEFRSLGQEIQCNSLLSESWQIKDMWKAHQLDGSSNDNQTAFAIKRFGSPHTPKQTEATPNPTAVISRSFFCLNDLTRVANATIHMEKQCVPKRHVWKSKDEMLKNVCNIMLHKSLMFSPSSI